MTAVIATSVQSGCSRPDPDIEPGPIRRIHAFRGNADPRFVGYWRTTPEPTALDLRKNGTAEIVAVVMSPKGKLSRTIQGEWRVSGSDLLLRYASTPQEAPFVLKYKAKLAGDKLDLIQAGNGVKSTYRRK